MVSRLDEPWCLPGLEVETAAAPRYMDWLWPRVIAPPPEIAAHVQSGGLEIGQIGEADRDLFAKAAEAISWVPSLAAIVAARVTAVHVLRADPGYDVSHSEPHWRNRIFVSVPDRHDEVGTLRLTEGVLHEALHLHLTQLEAISPLVRDLTGTLASPWRSDPRSFGGVLHGVFVFVGISAYFDAVVASLNPAVGCHLNQRRLEIAEELAEVDRSRLAAGLTERGIALLSRLLRDDVDHHRSVGSG